MPREKYDPINNRLMSYVNIGGYCGAVISTGKATLKELNEYYGLTDLFILIGIIKVDNYNRNLITEDKQKAINIKAR